MLEVILSPCRMITLLIGPNYRMHCSKMQSVGVGATENINRFSRLVYALMGRDHFLSKFSGYFYLSFCFCTHKTNNDRSPILPRMFY